MKIHKGIIKAIMDLKFILFIIDIIHVSYFCIQLFERFIQVSMNVYACLFCFFQCFSFEYQLLLESTHPHNVHL